MNTNDTNEPNISVYGDPATDFPLVKMIQEYIEAEQVKSHRRLMTLSVVFAVVLLTVIAYFTTSLTKANEQSQILNDRLVEYAMKEADRKAEEIKATMAQEATVKTLNSTVDRLQKQLEDQIKRSEEMERKSNQELAAAKADSDAAKTAIPELKKRQQETEAQLLRTVEQLKVEQRKLAEEKQKFAELNEDTLKKRKLAEEREARRMEEIERYRREHYPQYYARKDAADKVKEEIKEIEQEEERDEVDELLDLLDSDSAPKVSDETKDDSDKESDSYKIPVEVKGKRAGWRVPLD